MAIYLVLALCALGIAAMVYRYDMYDREPVFLLLLAAAAGVGCFWLAGNVEDYFLNSYPVPPPINVHAAITGICEEAGKAFVVGLVALACRRFFNDPVDGLIYGAFIGLGFGVGESVFYVSVEGPQWYQLPTEAVRMFLHTMMGGLGGYGIGLSVYPRKNPTWPAWAVGGILLAMLTHFLWNRFVGLVSIEQGGVMQEVAAVLLMLGLTGVFGGLVVIGSTLSREEFAPGDRRSVWGWPFRSTRR